VPQGNLTLQTQPPSQPSSGLRLAAAGSDPQPFVIGTEGGNIVLVTDTGAFLNTEGAQLKPTGTGHFVVAQTDWKKENRGGVMGSGDMPNRYGCSIGGTCVPDNNAFIYTDRPVATVFIQDAVRNLGEPNPNFGFSVSGVLTNLGDTAQQAAAGTPAANAPMTAGPGPYTIGPGNIDSRVGYQLHFVNGMLIVQPQGGGTYYPSVESAAAGLTLPQICTASAPAPVAYSENNSGDTVDREWSKVKQRLVLTSCTGLRLKESCGDF
jgi:hypothetical protein